MEWGDFPRLVCESEVWGSEWGPDGTGRDGADLDGMGGGRIGWDGRRQDWMGWEETGLDGDGRRKDWMGWEETGLDGMGGDRLGGTGRNRGKTRRVWVVWDETG